MNIVTAKSQGWKEVEGPQLFSFEKVGDSISGVVLELLTEKITDKESGQVKAVPTVKMRAESGTIFKFRPPYDLREKLTRSQVGKRMFIVYDHDDQSTSGKGNAMKMFRVFESPDAQSEAPFVGTDADIPF